MAITILKKGDIFSYNNRDFLIVLEPKNENKKIKFLHFEPWDDGSAPPDVNIEELHANQFEVYKENFQYRSMKDFWNVVFTKWT